MGDKREKYEAPIVYDLTGTIRDEVYAQNCRSGRSASASCTIGSSALNNCSSGRNALSRCEVGNDVVSAQDCTPGAMATGKVCMAGGMATQKCKAGGAK